MKRRCTTVLLIAILILGLCPKYAHADTQMVRVVVENTTYPVSQGSPWEGVCLESQVAFTPGMTMQEAIRLALTGISFQSDSSGYISSIQGLREMAAGPMSGWQGTLNDWFVNGSFHTILLQENDVVRIQYSTNSGKDLGGTWTNNDKRLRSLVPSVGTLSEPFSSDQTSYTLTVPQGTTSMTLVTTAMNKNFQVRYQTGGKEYQKNAVIPVTPGVTLWVICGDPTWPSVNNQAGGTAATIPACVYQVQFIEQGQMVTPPVADTPQVNTPVVETTDTPVLSTSYRKMLRRTMAYLKTQISSPTIASVGGEWMMMGLSRYSDVSKLPLTKRYLANVRRILSENKGVLSTYKYTEYSRVILSLTALGYDVTDVAGYHLLNYLADWSMVNSQGVNGSIWALTALDSGNYKIPKRKSGQRTTRERLQKRIMGAQLSSGGFALSGKKADIDVTAMALQALTPYTSNQDVKKVVKRGVTWLAKRYRSSEIKDAESVSQIIMALTALGINPDTDTRFIKKNRTLIDELRKYARADGSFAHMKGGAADGMATEQALCAMVAYWRLSKHRTSFFDMTDQTKQENVIKRQSITAKPSVKKPQKRQKVKRKQEKQKTDYWQPYDEAAAVTTAAVTASPNQPEQKEEGAHFPIWPVATGGSAFGIAIIGFFMWKRKKTV